MNTRLLLTWTAVLCCLASTGNAQEREAREFHDSLREMHAQIGEQIGFEETEQLLESELGPPMKVFSLRLDHIAEFEEDGDPREILQETNEIVFPIYFRGEIKSSMSFRFVDDTWVNTSLGGAEIHLIEPVRARHVEERERDHQEFFIVRAMALHQIFVGFFEDEQLMLVPAHPHDHVDDFRVSEAIPAQQALLALKPHTEKFEATLPRERR